MSGKDRSAEFQIKETLGQGTAGKAELCKKKDDGTWWVLKVIEGEIQAGSHKKSLNEGSIAEVAILAKLRHPNIIRYEDSWVQDTTLMILMEYADGGTLEDKWKTHCKSHQNIKEELVMKWAGQLLSAANYFHNINVLHRDIKLANIMMTKQDDIKLVDFGLARILDTQSFVAKTACGTPYYISPELCKGDPYDNKADIWALGCVIYELFALQRPFSGPNLSAVVNKIMRAEPDMKPFAHVSNDGKELVLAMLAKDHKQRPSAGQCLQQPYMLKYDPSPSDTAVISPISAGAGGAFQSTPCDLVDHKEASFPGSDNPPKQGGAPKGASPKVGDQKDEGGCCLVM